MIDINENMTPVKKKMGVLYYSHLAITLAFSLRSRH
jgi:hypothetical protein